MLLSESTVRAILEPIIKSDGGDIVGQYGEPGYHLRDAETPMVVLGSYWCRCGKHPRAGERKQTFANDPFKVIEPNELHAYEDHHPRIWRQMEAQGVEFEWYDEWLVDHEHDKAYRAHADSYSWTPTAIITDWGDLLTPDSPIDEWIAWALNTPTRCLFPQYADQLEAEGFVKWNADSYESGWHDGQDADPRKIHEELSERGHDEVVFVLDYNSQFYSGFSVYTRQEVPA